MLRKLGVRWRKHRGVVLSRMTDQQLQKAAEAQSVYWRVTPDEAVRELERRHKAN
jgi:hypothetical protein